MFVANYRDGIKLWSKQHSFGVLTRETFYNEDGGTVKEIEYLEDGSTETWLYDDNGDTTSITYTRPDGSVDRVEDHVYEYDEDMCCLLSTKVYVRKALLRQTECHYDEDQNMLGKTETTWHEDGSRTVCEYNDSFELVSETVYAAD